MNNLFPDTYASYGLSESPFLVLPLRPDARGKRLLVGRDDEIRLVATKLHKHGKITCIDGQLGVGKTSLVNVAAYECYQLFLEGKTSQLLIPMPEAFALNKDEGVEAFCARVFRKVAQTLLNYRSELEHFEGSDSVATKLAPWLNSPFVQHLNGTLGIQATVGAPGVFSAGVKADSSTATQINTSSGFNDHGFEQAVRGWLDQIFSVQGNGGVVCVIDNLELLETSTNAKRTLEALRDRLFTVNGLRWVFCGANGVIRSLAASPRLAAYLDSPVLELKHVAPASIAPLFNARLDEFSMNPDERATLPITFDDLQRLYMIMNFNLRDLLSAADQYCEYLGSLGVRPMDENSKSKRLTKWLDNVSTKEYRALSSRLPNEGWCILDIAMSDDYKGTFGVGDYGSFNSNSKVALTTSVFNRRLRDLVKLGLITKTLDDDADIDGEGEFQRDVFVVTSKGALVHYARLIAHETLGIKPTTWLKRVQV